MVKFDNILKSCLYEIEGNAQREDGLCGCPSGFVSLDRITRGWQKSNLIVIAARPSMGKTGFVLSMVRNMIVDYKIPVLFFTMEDTEKQIVTKLLSLSCELSTDKIKGGRLLEDEWMCLDSKLQKLMGSPLFVQAKFRELLDIKEECLSFKKDHNEGIIFIDNIQQIVNTAKNYVTREHEVGDIVRELKALAKELDMPIVITSSLNRETERRGGASRPRLSDIKDSGEIENIADVVCLIHRPEHYGIMEDEEGNSTRGLAQIIVAKNRNGYVFDVNLHFRCEFDRFEECDAFLEEPLEMKTFDGCVSTFESSINALF